MLRIGQVEATATQDGKYTDGSVAGGIAATRLRAAAFNAMQEELAHIVESAGLTLDINDMTQVLKAIQKLTLSRTNPFADIKSDGAAAISTALTNLGLGTAATKNVGVGAGQIPDMSSFTNASGWQKLPGGKILQWGKAGFPVGQTQISVPFPINFPSVVSNIQLTFADINFSGGTPSPTLAVVNNTVNGAGFGAYMSGAGGFNAYFFAIGS